MRVFYGMIGGVGTDRKVGGGYVENICCSAASMWTGKKFKRWQPPKHSLMFIDSGGYSFFQRKGDYPFSCADYVEMTKQHSPDFVAVRDYPCEPDIKRSSTLRTNIQRIDATIENTIKCREFSDVPWVSIVQGYKLSEYQYCCDQIKAHGLETPLMAIGSLCVRKRTADSRRIIRLVRSNFSKARLHGFGIDFRFLKDIYIAQTLWSSDTQAWQFGYPSSYFPKNQAQALKNYESYSKAIDRLLTRYQANSKISEWCNETT